MSLLRVVKVEKQTIIESHSNAAVKICEDIHKEKQAIIESHSKVIMKLLKNLKNNIRKIKNILY